MPAPRDREYVSMTSDLSNVREFVAGFQDRNKEATKSSLAALAVGVVTTAALDGLGRRKAASKRKHRK